MVFQKPNPFPKSIYDNVAFGPRVNGDARSDMDDLVEESLTGPRCGTRSRTSCRQSACRPVGRPAAAAVHRPGHRRQARRHPDGRAVLGPRPDRHHPHRGAHDRAEERLHDRRRDPQHAAGGPGLGPHRLLHRRGRRPRAAAPGSWSSRTAPSRSSPRPPTSAPTTTSPAASAESFPFGHILCERRAGRPGRLAAGQDRSGGFLRWQATGDHEHDAAGDLDGVVSEAFVDPADHAEVDGGVDGNDRKPANSARNSSVVAGRTARLAIRPRLGPRQGRTTPRGLPGGSRRWLVAHILDQPS